MHSFQVALHSFEDVRDFVFLAAAQCFEITVHSGENHANGKSLMVMLSLDYSRPMWVRCFCDAEQAHGFMQAAQRFMCN